MYIVLVILALDPLYRAYQLLNYNQFNFELLLTGEETFKVIKEGKLRDYGFTYQIIEFKVTYYYFLPGHTKISHTTVSASFDSNDDNAISYFKEVIEAYETEIRLAFDSYLENKGILDAKKDYI